MHFRVCVCVRARLAAPLGPVEFEWVGPVSEPLATSTHLLVLGWRRFMQEPGRETLQITAVWLFVGAPGLRVLVAGSRVRLKRLEGPCYLRLLAGWRKDALG